MQNDYYIYFFFICSIVTYLNVEIRIYFHGRIPANQLVFYIFTYIFILYDYKLVTIINGWKL